MSLIQIQYRDRIYDDDDVTPITPIGSAAHADAFQIATIIGMAGWQPLLMDGQSEPRHSLDRMTGRTSIGELNVQLLDRKVASDNLVRWWTAFIGDADGRARLLGKKFQ